MISSILNLIHLKRKKGCFFFNLSSLKVIGFWEISQVFVYSDVSKEKKSTYKLRLSIMILDVCFWSCGSFSGLSVTCAPSVLPPLLYREHQSWEMIAEKTNPPRLEHGRMMGHSASVIVVEPVALFTCAVQRTSHLLLQLRRFTLQAAQKVVMRFTQRPQCCRLAALTMEVLCEISRNGVKVRRTQGVWTGYSCFGWTSVFFTETVLWCCLPNKVPISWLSLAPFLVRVIKKTTVLRQRWLPFSISATLR